ncbi:MAG: magnesium/cobalt transporter CorA [Deltaproteobacteria bacterium]|nr:magnesium/cobalt transporter CorA [Deltaproteobacteria bacterium]
MIRCTTYLNGTIRDDLPLAEISDVIPKAENQVWLDLEGEPPERMQLLKEEFGFHDLSLEDCVKAGQRAKVDEYPGYYFLVFYSPYWDAAHHRIRARELHCFVGPNYLVTAHREPIHAIQTARQRWGQHAAMIPQGIGFLVYTIMDSVIDEYFPLLQQLDASIEALEERLFQPQNEQKPDDLFRLKKNLLYLRKILAPKRDIFNALARRDQPLFSAQTQFYLRDVYDHVIRLIEQVDALREMATSLLDTYLSAVSNKTNTIMKSLTGVATVLMMLGLIAAVYGMNFRHMPELDWPYGYPAAVTLMGLCGFIMALYFRRKRWF